MGHFRPDAHKHSSKVQILRVQLRKLSLLPSKISVLIEYPLGDLETMRPSSSSDPHAAHHAITPVFIDFFAKEAAEQEERNAPLDRQGPFAELSPRHRPNATSDGCLQADSPVTVSALRDFLRSKGHLTGQHIHDSTVERRLIAINLSAETLLAALKIIHTPNHSLLRTLRVSQTECLRVTNKLKAIVNNSSGFKQVTIGAAQRSNNDPNQLIRHFLELMR